MRKLFITYLIIVTVLEAGLLIAHFACLPDTEDRFFMGRGSDGGCLYMDMDSREVYSE